MLFSVEFLTTHASEHLSEIYLYARLRAKGLGLGGSFDINQLSHHERYDLLPKLRKMRLVHVMKNRVLSHRRYILRNCQTTVCCNVPLSELETIQQFRGVILQALESYLGRKQYDAQRYGVQQFQIENGKFSKRERLMQTQRYSVRRYVDVTRGRQRIQFSVSNSTLSRFLGVSIRTITRWRKESKSLINNDSWGNCYFLEVKKCHSKHAGAFFNKKRNQWESKYLNITCDYYKTFYPKALQKPFLEKLKREPFSKPNIIRDKRTLQKNIDFVRRGKKPSNTNLVPLFGEELTNQIGGITNEVRIPANVLYEKTPKGGLRKMGSILELGRVIDSYYQGRYYTGCDYSSNSYSPFNTLGGSNTNTVNNTISSICKFS